MLWFKFLSICKILNYKSSKDTLRDHIFTENKIKLKNLKLIFKMHEHCDTIYINEFGLYNLLFKSKMKVEFGNDERLLYILESFILFINLLIY